MERVRRYWPVETIAPRVRNTSGPRVPSPCTNERVLNWLETHQHSTVIDIGAGLQCSSYSVQSVVQRLIKRQQRAGPDRLRLYRSGYMKSGKTHMTCWSVK